MFILVTCQAQSKTNGNLVTSKGEGSAGTCVFPWKYDEDDEWEYGCRDKKGYGGVGWCSFDKIYDGGWGYCTESCPSML